MWQRLHGPLISGINSDFHPSPKERCSGRRQMEPGSYSPPHVGWPLVPFSMAIAAWAWLGCTGGEETGSPCSATPVPVVWGRQTNSSACPHKSYSTMSRAGEHHCCPQPNRRRASIRLPKTLGILRGTDLCPPPSQTPLRSP